MRNNPMKQDYVGSKRRDNKHNKQESRKLKHETNQFAVSFSTAVNCTGGGASSNLLANEIGREAGAGIKDERKIVESAPVGVVATSAAVCRRGGSCKAERRNKQ